MEKFDAQAFLATLTPEQKEAVQNCKTTEELEEVMDKYDIALPEEMLEEIAGGRGGRLIATILAGITILSAGASITASAATSSTAASASASADASAKDSTLLGVSGDTIMKYEKMLAKMGINKGVDKLMGYIPVVGGTLKGPIKNLLFDAFHLKEEGEPAVTLDTISAQIKDLSKQIEGLDASLKKHMDANTLKFIEEINNLDTLSKYKDGIFSLSITKAIGFDKLKTLDEYNKDEQLLILAKLIGNDKEWDETNNIVYKLRALSKMLTGNNYLNKENFYNVLCESKLLQQNCMFYSEVQKSEEVQSYVARMMIDYFVTYAIVTQSMKAQQIIIDADRNGDLEAFNINNVRENQMKKWYDYDFHTFSSSIPGTLDEMQIELCGSNKVPDCVFSNYEWFSEGGRKEFINRGNEKTELVFSSRNISGEKDLFEGLYNSNYLTGDNLKKLLTAASSKGMSVADYLDSVNNPLPGDAKYLMVDTAVKNVVDKKSDGVYDFTENVTQKITVIDVNDVTQKRQDVPVYSYTHARQHGFGSLTYTDFYYNYNYYPMQVLSIQSVKTSDTNPFGDINDGKYEMKSGTYRLSGDMFVNGTVVVKNGCNVTIDMNGYSIDRMLSDPSDIGTIFKVEAGGYLNIVDSTASGKSTIKGGNSNKDGGAICVDLNGEARLENISISNNKSKANGGGICTNGKLTIIGCTVDNNSAKDGGGIYCGFYGTVNTSNSTKITNNTAANHGGGINNHGILSMIGSYEISGNHADKRGGGIYTVTEYKNDKEGVAQYRGNVFLNGGRISKNTADTLGGGIEFDKLYARPIDNNTGGLGAELSGVVIEDNEANEKGGGLDFSFTSLGYNTRTKITSCKILNNKTNGQGGGICASKNHKDSFYGDISLLLCNTEVTGNTSDKDGAGIYGEWNANLDIDGCNVSNNKSSEDGGGIFANGYLYIKKSTVNNNSCDVDGGGVCFNRKGGYIPIIEDTVINNNTCKKNGAGIWCQTNSSVELKLKNVEIGYNTGAYDGGGVYIKGKVELTNCDVHHNEASNKGGGLNVDSSGGWISFVGGTVHDNSAPKGSVLRYHSKAKYYTKDNAVLSGTIY